MTLSPKQLDQFNAICEYVADGGSLRQACTAQGIERSKVNRWILDDSRYGDKTLVNQYAQARDVQADALADGLIDIADDRVKVPDVNDRRLMVETRKWIASKLKPRKYGDKLALGGADDLPAIRQEVQERADAFTQSIATMAKRNKPETEH